MIKPRAYIPLSVEEEMNLLMGVTPTFDSRFVYGALKRQEMVEEAQRKLDLPYNDILETD